MNKENNSNLLVQPDKFIPDSEKWLYAENNIERLDKAIKWAESNPRRDNFDEIVESQNKN